MDTSLLTDYQLYELIQNDKLSKDIRAQANETFKSRNIGIEALKEIVAKHDSAFSVNEVETLQPYQKVLIVLFPIFLEIQMLIAGKLLAKGYKRKWNDYWLYVCIGYLLWTFVVLLIGRFWLFKSSEGNAYPY